MKKTICLNMIVKNESAVILRCLASVLPLIDRWVIVDTGSTDGTQQIIRDFLKDVPGDLYERPWINFAHNRNEALELGKETADYMLFIDADETLLIDADFQLPELDQDFYHIFTEFSGTKYCRVQLVKSALNWSWKGVLHEYLESSLARSSEILKGVTNFVRPDGHRSQDPQKFIKDAMVLEEALRQEPGHARYTFYLAQSYKDAGQHLKALENYEKRLGMGGWEEEVFWCKLQIGLLKEWLNDSIEEVSEAYKSAYSYRPTRLEPLYRLAHFLRHKNDFQQAYQVSKVGLTLAPSTDILFVEKWMSDYGLLLEFSIAAYWTERYLEALLASELILSRKNLPENIRECVQNNLKWIHSKLGETSEISVVVTR